MKLSPIAIEAIEASLSKGMMCEVLPTPSGVVVHHHPHRQDINFPFPLCVGKQGEASSLILSVIMQDKERVDLGKQVLEGEYWVLGIKGATAQYSPKNT